MTTRLPRTQLAIQNCRDHIIATNSEGSVIESFLTQHILVVMCAEVEQEIISILERRVSHPSDSELKNFAVAAGKKVLRSIGKKELSGFLNNFGSAAKEHFQNSVSDEKATLYGNVVSNRHKVAHSSGGNITFRELERGIDAALEVLAAVDTAIYVKNSEEISD